MRERLALIGSSKLPIDDPTLDTGTAHHMMQRLLADKINNYADIEELRMLLVSGAQADGVVTQGLTPLHYACYRDYYAAARLLLVRGAKVNAVDDVGYSALHLCAEQGNYRLIKLLLEYLARVCYVDPIEEKKDFPLRQSVDEPLRMAIRHGHFECAKLLLEHDANPNAKYFDGPEITQISPLDTHFLRLLLGFGANPNVHGRDGLTPLMKACRYRDKGIKAIRILLDYGADINAMALPKQDLRTPLHYAVLSGSFPLIKFLLENGALVNMPADYEKPSVLHIAVLRDDPVLVRYLLRAGADPNSMHGCFGSALHIACCSQKPNQYEVIESMLKKGADANIHGFDADGRVLKTPLVEYLRPKDDWEPDQRVVSLLLSYGGQVVISQAQTDPRGQLRNVIPLLERECDPTAELVLAVAEQVDSVTLQRVAQAETISPEAKARIMEYTRQVS